MTKTTTTQALLVKNASSIQGFGYKAGSKQGLADLNAWMKARTEVAKRASA